MHSADEITPQKAKEIQQQLRDKIEISALDKMPQTIGGADLSFDRGSDTVHAGIVTLALPYLNPLAWSLVTTEVNFPYIPGLLAFREIPPLMEAWKQMEHKPDVLILDGHGLAHPRRMGIATHFGIEADWPTIGCAKNILTGDYREPHSEKGSYEPIKEQNETIGYVLRSRTNVNPVFVSPGHRVSFEDARSLVMRAVGRYKLPETTRLAHRLVNELRRGEREPGYKER